MEALLQDKNLKRICVLILLSLWAWSVFGGTEVAGDSIGLRQMDGKAFIVYQIAPGETAYSVSRKYNVPFRDIAAANPGVDMNALHSGQQILVPVSITGSVLTPTISTEVVANPVSDLPQPVVESEQVSETSTIVDTPAETADVNPPAEEIIVSSDNGTSFATLFATYQSGEGIPVIEKGAATWIEENGIQTGGDRFYALSNTAPIGSIIRVRNMMNNRIVYAKVIGRLSQTETDAKVLVKLSAGAGERLNVLDNRFVVEVTYYISDDVENAD